MINENLTLDVLELQEKISSPILISTPEHANTRKESNPGGNKSQERDIVKKGMERLEKEIAQYTQIQVSTEQVDISLLKRCKLTDIPAVNLAIRNIQRALQTYVRFNDIDLLYCSKVGEVMDEAQAWCMNVEDMYNKAEVHSINV